MRIHRRRGCWLATCFLFFVGAVVVAVVVGGAAYFYSTVERTFPKSVEVSQPREAPSFHYTLSPAQTDALNRLGPPQAFSILFYDVVEAEGGPATVRVETWTYYDTGQSLQFYNGTLIDQAPIDRPAGAVVASPYRPEQFAAYMSLEQVLSTTGLTTYLVVPWEAELVAGGSSYYGTQLIWGLQGDRLLSVEGLALIGEE